MNHRACEPTAPDVCAALVETSGRRIGHIGAILPAVGETFGLSRPAWVAEIEIEPVLDAASPAVRYKKILRFPHMNRDMAFLAPVGLASEDVPAAVRDFGSDLIRGVRVFDVYRGDGIPEGMKSIAFAVRYQSSERTLTAEEVDSVHADLVDRLTSDLPLTLRG